MKSATRIPTKNTARRQASRARKPQSSSRHACIVPDKKMLGKFVALRSFADNTVVAFGTDAGRVIQTAQRKGVGSPVVMFVPAKKMICMY